MKMRKDRGENRDWQKVDARVLARILTAQNIDFVLPDLPHIAEFFAETLLTIPGIHACRVCLQGVTIQKGTMKIELCEECRKSRMLSSGQKELSPFLPDPNFKCGLADQPGFQVQPVISLYHHFGFFTFNVGEPGAFEVYRPFISNLASFMALSLENRLQRDALQKAQITLENEVADRTQELLAANSRLKEEVETRRQAEYHLHEREKHSQSLLRLSKRLEQAQTYAEVLNAAQDEVRAIIGYKNLWAYLISEDKQYAHPIVAGGPIEEVVMSEEGIATLTIKGDRMLEELLESKDIVVVEDAQTDERVNKEIVKRLGNRTIVNVPIILFNRHMGSVGTGTFWDEGVRVPTASERDYLMALASHLAVTLDRIHQFRERKKIEESLAKSEEKFRTIIEQSAEGILMADEDGTIVEWNHAYEKMTGVRRSEALGHPLWDIMLKIIAPERATLKRRETIKTGILDALRTGKSYLFDQPIEMEFYPLSSHEKHYFHQTIFPIKTAKGFRIASLIEDITERKRGEAIRQARLRLLEFANSHTLDELLTATLDEIELLTGSSIGFYHFLEADQKTLLLQEWSTNTLTNMCTAEGKGRHYDIDQAGVWVDCVRERRAVIHNNYASLPHCKGMPEGHAPVKREIVVPIFRGNLIKAIIGVGNKATDYNEADIEIVSQLGDLSWDIAEGKQATDWLRDSEQHSQSLLRLSRRLERAQSFADILNAAQDEVRIVIGYQNLWVYLYSDDKQYARALMVGGPKEDALMQEIPILTVKGDRILEEFVESTEIVIVEDARTDERTNKELVAKLENRTMVNVPILFFDRHLGAIGTGTFGEEGVRPPTNSEKEYLTAMASQLASAFDRIHLLDERQKAEEALSKNNVLLERIFASTEFMIAYLDTDFNFLRVNRAYAEADNRIPDFFIGKNHFDLYPNVETKAIFQQVVETGEPYVAYAKPFEYAEHPERGVAYRNWTLQPVKEPDGQVSGLVFSLIDVTEREKAVIALRESEERYRTLVQQASDGIFIANSQGKYIDVNPSGCAMLGYTREELLKLNMRDLASADSQAKVPLQFEGLRAGKSLTTERTLVTKSGALLPVEISGKVLDNGNFIGIVRDITERKRHELEREAIITVSQALRKATTRSEIITVLLDQLVSLFDADGSMIALPNPETKDIIIEMGRGNVGERFSGLIIPQGSGISSLVIANKEPYLNNRANHDSLFYRPDLLGDSVCVASVPLIAHEKAIGALWIARHTSIFEEELRLLTAIADIAANAIHRVMLHEQTIQQLHHLLALHQIDLAISTNFDLDVTLDVLLKNVKDELEVDAADILLFDTITHTLDYAHGIGFRTRGIEESRVRLGDGYAGRAAQSNSIVSCPDLRRAEKTFSRSSLLADEKFIAYFVSPLVSKGQIKGVLEVFIRKPFQPENEWLDYFETLATQATIAIESAYLFENLQRSNTELILAYDATIEGWSLALDLRDKETEGHTRRVMDMALNLARKMGMNELEMLNLKRGALLHDIGKMGVPDSILLKQGPLTTEEWEIMHQHPVSAYHMLKSIAYLKNALEIPYCHHEHWDGSGYPRGLKGEEIPLAARVFAVVDVFDALTSDRPYRRAWTDEKAYRYIESQAGKHFDPKVVKIFLENQ